jgi:hypothetical protein
MARLAILAQQQMQSVSPSSSVQPEIVPLTNLIGGWALRQLVVAYTGPLFRVARSSDLAELDVYTATGTNTADVNSMDTFRTGGSLYIRTLYDQTGAGHDIHQVAGTEANVLADGNNHLYIAINNNLYMTSATVKAVSLPVTIVAVASAELANDWVVSSKQATNRGLMGGTTTDYALQHGGTITGGTRDSDVHTWIGMFGGAGDTSLLYIDGVMVASGDTGTSDDYELIGIGAHSGPGQWQTGSTYEVLAYSGNKSSDVAAIDVVINDALNIHA